MLPATKRLYDHPRVQAEPTMKELLEELSDMDRFERLTHMQLAFRFGLLSGFLMNVLEEYDALKQLH